MVRSNAQVRSAWEHTDQYQSYVKSILGNLIIKPTPLERDRLEVADFQMIHHQDFATALRIRFTGFDRYPWDITFRSSTGTGALTEMDKIVTHKLGQYMLYCHALPEGPDGEVYGIRRWYWLCLNGFRHWFTHPKRREVLRYTERSMDDGTKFVAVDLRRFPSNPPVFLAWGDNVTQKVVVNKWEGQPMPLEEVEGGAFHVEQSNVSSG